MFGTKVISLILLLLSRVILARLLGPAGLGSFGSALNLTTIISRWGSAGIGPATQFMSGKYPDSKNTILTYATLFSLILGLVNIALVYAFGQKIAAWQFTENPSAEQIFNQLFPFLPIIILSMTLPVFLLGTGRYQFYSQTQIIPLLIQTIILSSAFWRKATMETVVIAQVFYWLSTVIIGFIYIGFQNFDIRLDRALFHTYIKLALSMWPLVIFQFGLARLPVLIGSQYLGSKDLGYYLLALNIAESFFLVHTSITPIVFNHTINKQSDPAFLAKSIRFSNLLLLSAFTITCLIGKPIFTTLFGEDFNLSWALLLRLFPWVLVHGMVSILLNYLIAAGERCFVFCTQSLAFVILIILGTVLSPHYRAAGLCLAGFSSSLTAFILAFLIIRFSMNKELRLMALFLPIRQDWKDLYSMLSGIKKKKGQWIKIRF